MSGSRARAANERIFIVLSRISHHRSVPSSGARVETRSRFPLAIPHISQGGAVMKTFKYLLVAAVAVPALAGPGFAQTSNAAGKSLAGALVSVDQAAKTVTVKHMVDSKPMHLTMNVEDSAIATLAQLK